MSKGMQNNEGHAQAFIDKYLEEFIALSVDDKEIVSNKFLDMWIEEKIQIAEKAIEEEPVTILERHVGGIEDIHGKALILAMLLHEEQQVKENEVFELVEQVLFDLVYYLDERKEILEKFKQ